MSERPAPTNPTTPGSVLFADVADSSRLYARLGDQEANRIVRAGLALAQPIVANHAGHVVEVVGDELFCEFGAADASLLAAIELQDQVRLAIAEERFPAELRFRIGVHAGELEREGQRVFGNTVYVAHRVCERAKAGQILTTRETLERVGEGRVPVRVVDSVVLKGQTREHELVEVLCGPDPTIETGGRTKPRRAPATVLELSTQDLHARYEAASARISLGRDAICDVTVSAGPVSRRHATIEHGEEGWRITDVSTNGTLVRPHDRPDQVVHQKSTLLLGTGTLFLGADANEPDSSVKFAVLPKDAGS